MTEPLQITDIVVGDGAEAKKHGQTHRRHGVRFEYSAWPAV